MRNLSITEQINTQYREYALYVLQSRGIPNFYDFLTPVQRLIILNSPNRFNKTVGLVGEVIKTGLYHHGDSSLSGAISKLAKPFGCSHQILDGDGFFGSPVNPSPSAPRYTSVKINSKIREIVDKHVDLNKTNEEGSYDWINVEFPVGLLTHMIGIAVGYRTNILPRKLEDVQEYLEGQQKLLKPYFRDFNGKITKFKNEESTWMLESGFEVDETKKTIRIFDLPPILRYDTFMIKLESKLESLGFDYRIENRSQSKCDLTVQMRSVDLNTFRSVCESISRLTKVIVKEDIVLVKDGCVIEFNSVKDYLDTFRIHLEEVRLNRLLRDAIDLSDELEFLEAKLKFINFMITKKRSNSEIMEFLSGYSQKISAKLQRIEAIKLSSETIEETKNQIAEIKKKISENKKLITEQKSKFNRIKKEIKTSAKSLVKNSLFEPTQIDGIEIFKPAEDDSFSEEFQESRESFEE